jgi:hypothetical protein
MQVLAIEARLVTPDKLIPDPGKASARSSVQNWSMHQPDA